jgi:hypothetical protein
MRVQWKTHDNTIITTSNQTILDLLNSISDPIVDDIDPVKLLPHRYNQTIEWKLTKKDWEYNETHMTIQSLQQATKQHLTHTNW